MLTLRADIHIVFDAKRFSSPGHTVLGRGISSPTQPTWAQHIATVNMPADVHPNFLLTRLAGSVLPTFSPGGSRLVRLALEDKR